MSKKIEYQRTQAMNPREGVNFATVYIKQTLSQRRELCQHIKQTIEEIAQAIEQDSDLAEWIRTPLQGFKTTKGVNRSVVDILTDMTNEARGLTKNNMPKDFAQAPIDRWNRLFANTDYAIDLVKAPPKPLNNFDTFMEFEDDSFD